jgi:hypothetical protein
VPVTEGRNQRAFAGGCSSTVQAPFEKRSSVARYPEGAGEADAMLAVK